MQISIIPTPNLIPKKSEISLKLKLKILTSQTSNLKRKISNTFTSKSISKVYKFINRTQNRV